VGEKQNQPFQLSFNASLKVDFQGSRVTSDGGLILVRELDERLGLSGLIDKHLADHRQGKNTQFPLADLLRRSVYSRLAGAALTSRLQSFETEMLAEDENFAGLAAINRELIAKAEAVDSPQRGVVPARGLHRDQPGDGQPGGSAVLHQARYGRAVDQRRQAGGEDDAPELSPFPVERGAAVAECDRLQPGQPVAATGAAEEDRWLVLDQSTAAAGENGWAAGETRPVLLAAAGRESSDAATVWKHGAADRGAAGASGVGEGCGGKEIGQRGGRERKGVGGISQKGRSCWPRGPREKQDNPLGTAGQALRRKK
jgi:hypothetical protein